MPAPGDQHSVIANPFQEQTNRVSQYTAQEIATLQSRLQKQLGPEYISSRQGPSGQKVHYITAEKCIALANEVFGFNGWSSSIQNIQVDFVDEHEQTFKISLGLSVVVRVTLRDGTYHEDVGYGHIENCKGKAAAFEKAKKEGTTDALKRALRNFGNVLGNCIYDKAYLAKVTKMKVDPTKFDTDRLHRHSDFAIKSAPPAKVENVAKPNNSAVPPPPPPPPQLISADSFEDLLGEFDEADFNIAEEGHPDEVVLTNSNQGNSNSNQAIPGNRSIAHAANNNNASMQPPSRALTRSTSAGNPPSRYQPHTPNPNQQSPQPNNFRSFNAAQNNVPQGGAPRPQQPQQFNQNRPQPPVLQQQHGNHQNAQAQMTPPPQPGGQNGGTAAPPGEAVGFFSARAVKELPEDTLNGGQVAPKAGQVFNPHAESPSIRKTPGIDHTKSKPLSRTGQHVPPSVSAVEGASAGSPGVGIAIAGGSAPPLTRSGPPMARGNVINPQFDHARRIGAPGAASPLSNRGQYRPPTMKRPAVPVGAGSGAAGDLGLGSGVAAAGGARPPLSDISNNPPLASAEGGKVGNPEPDSKRQRIS